MGARLRSWWKQIKQHLGTILVVTIILVVAIALIIVGYRFDWTGFNGNNKSGKTLWDWMQLLFIPVVLAIAGFWFNHRERKAAELRAEAEREIEQQRVEADRDISIDNQREAALKEYIDKMSELLLHENLRKSGLESEVRQIARIQTLTVLHRLDSERKKSVLQFLYESELIDKADTIVDLRVADLSSANLRRARLDNVCLNGAHLNDVSLYLATLDSAHMFGTYLRRANLQFAYLKNTVLRYAFLEDADLSKAYLYGADLSGANLSEAILTDADLSSANLSEATVTPEQLAEAKSLKGATMPDGSIHP